MVLVVRKFDFGQSFDRPETAPSGRSADGAVQAETLPEPVFSQADIEAAESRGFVSGQLEGARLAAERREHQVALALADIAGVLPSLSDQLREGLKEIERQAANILAVTAERLFPRLVAEFGRGELSAMLDAALERAIEEPRVTIRCAPAIETDIEELANAAAARAGFGGKLTIIGDPALSDSSCRAEWSGGGLERDPAALLAQIEATLRRALESEQ